MVIKRVVKSISLASAEQWDKLETLCFSLVKQASPAQKQLMGDVNVSRMNQLIAEGQLGVAWKDWGQLHYPIIEMIGNKQPFKIIYSDVTGKSWGYTVMYAQIVERMYRMGNIRPYLDCWCEEGSEAGNSEISQLSHNWTLRVDSSRYATAKTEPIKGKWRSQGLDYVDVKIQLTGALGWGYEANKDDIEDSGNSPSRTIVRRITSSYWLMRELAPHIICHPGSVSIVEPEEIRDKYLARFGL